jgi:hypothetical protein
MSGNHFEAKRTTMVSASILRRRVHAETPERLKDEALVLAFAILQPSLV